jgi:hypothetical protein
MSKAYDRYATLADQQGSRYSESHEGQKMRLPRSGALVVLWAGATVQQPRRRENTCDLSRYRFASFCLVGIARGPGSILILGRLAPFVNRVSMALPRISRIESCAELA